MTAAHSLELLLIGLAAGVLGSLLGLGGGFLAGPALRMLFSVAPASVAGAALVMVLANAASGSLAYLRQRRVDLRMALLVALTGVPASVLGAILVRFISPVGFDALYGVLLLYFAIDILRRRKRHAHISARIKGGREHVIRDAFGHEHRYGEHIGLLLGAGVIMGIFSSFFGIGGGLIMIPTLMLFGVPAHIITATSTFAILLTAPVGVITHQLTHGINWSLAVPLASGGLIGGQIGPRIAARLSSPQLLTALGVALVLTAISLVFKHLF